MLKMFTFSKSNRASQQALEIGLQNIEFLISNGHKIAAFDLLKKLSMENPGNTVLTGQTYSLAKELGIKLDFKKYRNIH